MGSRDASHDYHGSRCGSTTEKGGAGRCAAQEAYQAKEDTASPVNHYFIDSCLRIFYGGWRPILCEEFNSCAAPEAAATPRLWVPPWPWLACSAPASPGGFAAAGVPCQGPDEWPGHRGTVRFQQGLAQQCQ